MPYLWLSHHIAPIVTNICEKLGKKIKLKNKAKNQEALQIQFVHTEITSKLGGGATPPLTSWEGMVLFFFIQFINIYMFYTVSSVFLIFQMS